MWKVIGLSIVQSAFLAGGQVFLKLAMQRIEPFHFAWKWFWTTLTNGYLIASGACMLTACLLWFYIIKNFQFSVAYPATSIAYIFGMLAAVFIFQESVPLTRWIGVIVIMLGVGLVVK